MTLNLWHSRISNFQHHGVQNTKIRNNKCDLNHHDHSNAVLATYSNIFRPSKQPSIYFNTRSVWMQQPVQQLKEKNTSCTFSRSSRRTNFYWELKTLFFFSNETIKTAAYLPRAIFPPILSRGDEKGITLRPDILHISETWSFRCESHPCVERCDEKQLSL